MLKHEIICDSCGNHYIVVTQDDSSSPNFCSFCSSPLPEEEQLEVGDDE